MHLLDQQLNHMIRGRFQDGWTIAQELERRYPDDHRAKFNRGWFLINQGQLQQGYQCLEYGRSISVYGDDTKTVKVKPKWDQSDLQGKTVILNLEGGFGDNIMQSRFATDFAARGAKCLVNTDKRLHGILGGIKGVDACITNEYVRQTHHDWHVPGFSAVWMLGHDFDTLPHQPFITANPDLMQVWRSILRTDKPKVGIRWSGLPTFEHQQFRLFPPRKLIDLHKKFPHIQFVSLQKDDNLIELPPQVKDVTHFLETWDDTAACIANLDLVISSCTSVAHLAASMGLPTWILVPILPYHCWAYGDEHSPWYAKTCRLFRQVQFGNWDHTFHQIEQQLQEKFPHR